MFFLWKEGGRGGILSTGEFDSKILVQGGIWNIEEEEVGLFRDREYTKIQSVNTTLYTLIFTTYVILN